MQIPETMKALVAYGKGNYRFEPAYPTPICGPDDILIKTEGCGICAGDLKCMHGAERFWGNETAPAWVRPPFIPGHEFLGRIVQIGENVTEYQVGERITADQIVPCGKCRFCKTGRYWMCQPHATFGFQKENNGGMAEYVRYPKTAVLHRVPEELPLEQALLIEPYACAKHCVDRAQITNEDIVVLSGAGTLGLSRRIVGLKTLTSDILQTLPIPEDTVALSGYNVDIHGQTSGIMTMYPVAHAVGIPYGCLVPEKTEGLIIAGRPISVDQTIFGMTRVMSTCMAVGEAAGTAAAMALDAKVPLAALDVPALRTQLKKQHAILEY